MLRWHTLSTYFRALRGRRVQKIPLDAGSTCPNRDGTLSFAGCSFCNAHGSGSGLWARGDNLAVQWRFWQAKYCATDNDRDFLAYFQSFSNTYGPLERLRHLLNAVERLPGNVGVSLASRPDCVSADVCDILAACPLPEVWLELGLQSAHESSLARVGRRHSRADAERAVALAASRNIKVCAHLMAGLPGESVEHFIASVQWAVSLPIAGVKLHSLYVCKGSDLAHGWARGEYTPLTQNAYVDALARALPHIPSHIVIHRLTGDPAPGELLAPEWTLHKRPVFTALYRLMRERTVWQGSAADVPDARPQWYGG